MESQSQRQLRHYTAAELAEATAGFSHHCLVGTGGFGNVYRAMVSLTPVAIKLLDSDGLQGLREMEVEMRLLASLHHPHLVRLLGYASELPPGQPAAGVRTTTRTSGGGGCQALVYELMTRGNLEDCLARKGRGQSLPWAARVRIASQVASALAFLHSRGIIHRDIKPANIFLDASLNAKLGDIGLAAMDARYGVQPGSRGGENAGEAVGTWQYLAPEYRNQTGARSTMQTDAYAFGLTLLQLVTGAPSPRQLVHQAQAALEKASLTCDYLDASAGSWDARLGERLVKLALWCCMHNPEERPALTVVASDLHRLAEQAASAGHHNAVGLLYSTSDLALMKMVE